jgi:hypothetical protein
MLSSIYDSGVQAALDVGRAGGGTLFPSPEDWRDLPIYFLMVDRFNNDKASPKNLPFDASFGQFQGGSFAGARAKLPYIKAMGFGAIWLSPVLKNPAYDPSAYHGYGIQNFLAAEPRFASTPTAADAELRQLVDAAHALGLYVILDIILHHAGNVFAYRTAGGFKDQVDWQNQPIPVGWKNAAGTPDPTSTTAPTAPTLDGAVLPREFCRNELFTARGTSSAPADKCRATSTRSRGSASIYRARGNRWPIRS